MEDISIALASFNYGSQRRRQTEAKSTEESYGEGCSFFCLFVHLLVSLPKFSPSRRARGENDCSAGKNTDDLEKTCNQSKGPGMRNFRHSSLQQGRNYIATLFNFPTIKLLSGLNINLDLTKRFGLGCVTVVQNCTTLHRTSWSSCVRPVLSFHLLWYD